MATSTPLSMQQLLKLTFDTGASDLHIVAGSSPTLRIDGKLQPAPNTAPIDGNTTQQLVLEILNPQQKDRLLKEKELDFSVALPGIGRFRANAYFQKKTLGIALRTIKEKVPTIDELRLPKICHTFAGLRQGFILVTGPTGHGKSSTLSSIIEEINTGRAEHIVTIEDPIEFVYTPKKSIVSQRELGEDTLSWAASLKSVLREDPDVVLVGEMRDPETMAAAITVAETGHLVFATLHTNNAAQTVDRIIDSFPEEQQNQIRLQLSNALEAILAQRLIPATTGGRVPATEILVATPAVRNTIREGKTHQIDNIIQTSSEVGMATLESSLAYWVNQGVVDIQTARSYALRPADLDRLVKTRV